MVEVHTNEVCLAEKKYIFHQIFQEFLGVEFVLILDNSLSHISITRSKKKIILSSAFFQQFRNNEWLSLNTMPKLPLSYGTFDVDLNTPMNLPIIYGNGKYYRTNKLIELGLDIFGSSFFMLSRYEELVLGKKDFHSRFPAKESIAYKGGFLLRPIIDEYIVLLWRQIGILWPELKRRESKPQTFVSCDVDHIWDKGIRFPNIFTRLAADLAKRKSFKQFFGSLKLFIIVYVFRMKKKDPFKTFDFMMEECEKRKLKMAFYFIPKKTKKTIDGDYNIESEEVVQLMGNIIKRGHEVGYHGSYDSYNNKEKTLKEVDLLMQVYKRAGGNADDIRGGRQHYLRWETGVTEKNWEAAGMEYDSTLGYAEQVGFRCGTSREYNFYNGNDRKPLKLKIRPLVIMEVSLFNENYMNLSYDEANSIVNKINNITNNYEVNFSLLWHNSSFKTKKDKTVFKKFLDYRGTKK